MIWECKKNLNAKLNVIKRVRKERKSYGGSIFPGLLWQRKNENNKFKKELNLLFKGLIWMHSKKYTIIDLIFKDLK